MYTLTDSAGAIAGVFEADALRLMPEYYPDSQVKYLVLGSARFEILRGPEDSFSFKINNRPVGWGGSTIDQQVKLAEGDAVDIKMHVAMRVEGTLPTLEAAKKISIGESRIDIVRVLEDSFRILVDKRDLVWELSVMNHTTRITSLNKAPTNLRINPGTQIAIDIPVKLKVVQNDLAEQAPFTTHSNIRMGEVRTLADKSYHAPWVGDCSYTHHQKRSSVASRIACVVRAAFWRITRRHYSDKKTHP